MLARHGYDAVMVAGDDPATMHEQFAATLDDAHTKIREIQATPFTSRPRWPAIVLRTPKGWTGPDVVDGVQVLGTFRSHQVPLSNVRDNAAHLAMLEEWMRSYGPDDLFDAKGAFLAS